MADAQHLPHGRHRAGDRHLNFHETRDNLPWLTATWARQQHWYVNVSWADEAVHAVTPGATAAAACQMLAKFYRLPDVREVAGATPELQVAPVILRGLGLATVCEFEWVEKQYSLRARREPRWCRLCRTCVTHE